MMSDKPLLVLKNIDVHYDKIHIIKRVSLHINRGEIVALIGANGAGKTTLLRTISGLIKPTGGSVEYDGSDITGSGAEKIVALGISHVPERGLVFKPMTVEDNLVLGAYHRYSFGKRGLLKYDVEHIYSMFPVLGERRKQLAGTLSGGEQQMLAIGRALMAKPKLLLMDEPGMGLAPLIIKNILNHIVELRNTLGLTIMLIEQNARSALKIADIGYVIETGRIILREPAEDLLLNRDVQRAYLGRDVAPGF